MDSLTLEPETPNHPSISPAQATCQCHSTTPLLPATLPILRVALPTRPEHETTPDYTKRHLSLNVCGIEASPNTSIEIALCLDLVVRLDEFAHETLGIIAPLTRKRKAAEGTETEIETEATTKQPPRKKIVVAAPPTPLTGQATPVMDSEDDFMSGMSSEDDILQDESDNASEDGESRRVRDRPHAYADTRPS